MSTAGALERAYRDERTAVLATITRRLDGDLALAEDVVQDAFVAAAVDWERRGVPDRPGAWLTTTAWRKALDRLRRDRVAALHAQDLVQPVSYDSDPFEQSLLDDDQLRMLFACCHPALSLEARMALTLRSVAGLTVPEIARAFLSSESAMERRLTRARRKVSDARIPVRVPPDELLMERLGGVLRVVYLIYNEGHVATRGAVRGDLCEEEIRLARLRGAVAARPSPVVAVNRAVAVGFAAGPAAGLAILEGLDDGPLARYQPLHAARAELLRRSGDAAGAEAAYATAIALSANDAERAALERRRG